MPLDPPLGSIPRQARGVRARANVYDRAIEQFAARGVAETRIEDVVEAAGVAWGTFFRYFPRKEDVLLEAGVRHLREHVLPVVEAAMADASCPTREAGRQLFVTLLSPGDHPPSLHAEIVHEVVERRERFAAMLGDQLPLVALATRIVDEGQARGEVRTDVNAPTLAGVLSAGTVFPTLHGYYHHLLKVPAGARAALPSPAAFVERCFEVVWRGLEPA